MVATEHDVAKSAAEVADKKPWKAVKHEETGTYIIECAKWVLNYRDREIIGKLNKAKNKVLPLTQNEKVFVCGRTVMWTHGTPSSAGQ